MIIIFITSKVRVARRRVATRDQLIKIADPPVDKIADPSVYQNSRSTSLTKQQIHQIIKTADPPVYHKLMETADPHPHGV